MHESQLSIIYRPVIKSEQAKALELWQTVFGPKGDGYFERYFLPTASPNYRDGDSLGAWSADNLLVSVVHIRRITLRSDEETFLCGVVSNMATLAEFRNQGLSWRLLALAIEKMEQEDFDLSILGTGRSNHYLPLGWEPITVRVNYVINIPDRLSSSNYEVPWVSVSSITSYDQLHEFYSLYPRSYQFDRDSSIMFEHWIGWHWQEDLAYICVLPNERGYAVISQPDGKHGDVCISEWRAVDIDVETKLLRMAATEVRRRYRRNNFLLYTLPQYTSLMSLGWDDIGLISEQNDDIMIRNIRLADDLFKNIKAAFENENEKATIWPGEYF
ncbi:unnamed protein product [Rotaria magnacalcarata]|uniref:N-acetyltransferase domain-containing protein n=4 Tax=Rotaria magnacalcarata TaxID=392030 RepID=A0A819WMV6_9BILA|nr:unnamed protein product [Rotaria magnacalcarata]CAF2050300.1 unnamed protein product [Rotaria magnacalcarata]CAF4124378.1 unnamed protein product [Rotaria magnacalcarata]